MNEVERNITIIESSSEHPSVALKTVAPEILNNQDFLIWVVENKLIDSLPIDSLTRKSAEFIFQQDENGAALLVGCSGKEEICLAALKIHPDLVTFIPPRMRSEEFYQKAVRENSEVFCYLPLAWRTKEYYPIILDSIQNNPKLVAYLPDSELQLQLFKDVSDYRIIDMMMCWIGSEDVTKEIADEAIRKSPVCLQFIPEVLRTPELCLIAVKKDIRLDRHVPENIKRENNIYTFNKTLTKAMGKGLPVEEVKELYNRKIMVDVGKGRDKKVSLKWSEARKCYVTTNTPGKKRKL